MLDKISKRILAELQDDGRISNVELASRVNLSPAACLERVRKLQESGYILGYTARLNPQLLNVALLVFIEVVLDRTTPEVFDDFKRSVQTIPEVLECHMVAGGFDYLVKARVGGMDAYRQFLSEVILPLNAPLMALTPISAFRPRRWRGALLPDKAMVAIDVLEADKRPVSAVADHYEIRNVARVEIAMDHATGMTLLHDPGHSLDERILREQFGY